MAVPITRAGVAHTIQGCRSAHICLQVPPRPCREGRRSQPYLPCAAVSAASKSGAKSCAASRARSSTSNTIPTSRRPSRCRRSSPNAASRSQPEWRGSGSTLLNARTDSLRRGSFKTMLANKRCVIPAEGFYEWREENGKKQPYFFARKDGKPVMFAGIWDYSDVKGEAVPSFAILTDEPNELVAPYHDRMPVVLGDVERWLNLDTTLDDVDPLGPERFVVRAVNPAVNKVSEKNIDAIERAA